MSTENQQTVTAWSFETFGPPATVRRALVRANLELAELLTCYEVECHNATPIAESKMPEECADVAICLFGAFELAGETASDYWSPGDFAAHDVPVALTYVYNQFADEFDILDDLRREGTSHLALGPADFIASAFAALHWICKGYNTTLAEAIDRKMVTNRRRAWKLDGTGCGQHIDEEG